MSTNNPIKSFSDMLLSLNSYEFNLVAMLIGYLLAEDQSPLAQSSLGNFFESVGQVLETIGSQGQYLNQQSTKEIICELKMLTKRINHLEELINNLFKL